MFLNSWIAMVLPLINYPKKREFPKVLFPVGVVVNNRQALAAL
nr:MAG TPA: hypothetical protein [Caudoviricetes sp.]DAO00482.1 MAG TPA: hypothetical protein [Bacteriophage sp.]DAS77933.1 MAG TPA: hypothetical protein [Caudoviricetes sp.]